MSHIHPETSGPHMCLKFAHLSPSTTAASPVPATVCSLLDLCRSLQCGLQPPKPHPQGLASGHLHFSQSHFLRFLNPARRAKRQSQRALRGMFLALRAPSPAQGPSGGAPGFQGPPETGTAGTQSRQRERQAKAVCVSPWTETVIGYFSGSFLGPQPMSYHNSVF